MECRVSEGVLSAKVKICVRQGKQVETSVKCLKFNRMLEVAVLLEADLGGQDLLDHDRLKLFQVHRVLNQDWISLPVGAAQRPAC